MSFADALGHLTALGHELAAPNAPRRKFDLAHMRALTAALGDPQLRFPSILIAGTNGKGSTAATLAHILAAAGLRTALYTSPHLTQPTERIRTNTPLPTPEAAHPHRPTPTLHEIPEADFARLFFHVDETARRLVADATLPHPPSYFETLTALAFLYFAEQNIQLAVLEVGLGGRLDATNIVDPLVSILTDISYDHQDYLGTTLTAITREKAGILRPHGTLITLPQHPEANQAIGEAAVALEVRAINAADFLPGRDFLLTTNATTRAHTGTGTSTGTGTGAPSQLVQTEPEVGLPTTPTLPRNTYTLTLDNQPLHIASPLLGQHQQRNIALAIAAAAELRQTHGYAIPNAAIEAGVRNTVWPGRLEFLPPNLLLDVAHNPAGAWTLRAAIAQLPDSQPRTLLFSCLRDKDLREIAQILFPLFDATASPTRPGEPPPRHNIILTPLDNPRAASLEDLLATAERLDTPAHTAPTPAAALALAQQITPPGGLIIATGSIYLIGALRTLATS